MSSCITDSFADSFEHVVSWSNLLLAFKKASKGKRRRASCSQFEHKLADNLLTLQQELIEQRYQPGEYVNFFIHEPKQRKISAAPFRDRVVHHALCHIIEPIFERRFIKDSYANRKNKGTHAAIHCLQAFSRQYDYVLRLDIVKHFQSIDHQILYKTLEQYLQDETTLALIQTIIDSGKRINQHEVQPYIFPDDDLLSLTRPRGLPIGNLTSQFWSNCYMHPLDQFIKRELRCKGYCRYVDDFALFSNSKQELWDWKQAVQEKLDTLRLHFHEHSAQVVPVKCGIPWLGFVVYPQYRRVKRRKVVHTGRKLANKYNPKKLSLNYCECL